MNTTSPFQTQDLNMAAYMWAQTEIPSKLKDVAIIAVKPKKKCAFCFELEATEQQVNDLVLKFQNRDTCVEPNDFVRCQTHLRGQIKNVI